MKIGYCMCGSFCTLCRSLKMLRQLVADGNEVQPIMSESVYYTDTRFFEAEKLKGEVKELCSKPIIHTVKDAEPLGPRNPQDLMIISPCTGNTLAKLARGITDTAVTMAAKAQLRADRPLLIALSSNDALSQNLQNLALLLNRRGVYFLPMRQDDPEGKPHSLVADFERMPEGIAGAMMGKRLRPLFY